MNVRDIKRAQKEKLLLRTISNLFLQAALDEPRLSGLVINRVSLSSDKSLCTVYFYTSKGKAEFDEKLEILKLYKPSLRAALAKEIKSRYTPDLKFKFDDQFEKHQKLESLMYELKDKDELK